MRAITISQVLISATLAAFVHAPLLAQCAPGGPPDPQAMKGAIVGLVLDRTNRPIENADVFVTTPRRQARTRPDGLFQLMDLEPGTYTVVVRRIGYPIVSRNYIITDSGGVARFCLAAEIRLLPPTISSIHRGGLSGVIGDGDLKPLPDAEVRAVGAGEHTTTDSAGSFFLDLKRGTYAIMISKPGYSRQLMSVTIPKDSGRQITAFLGAPRPNANRMAMLYDDMRLRMLNAPPSRSGIMSNEDLMKTSADLRGAAQHTGRIGIVDDCPAIVNGGPYSVPIYMIDKRDVDMLEVYAFTPSRRGRSGGGFRTLSGQTCNARIYVWIRP